MTPRGRVHPGFLLVFAREFHWFRRRPFLLFLTTVLPLLLMGLLAAVFSAGLATRLPIAVLDQDGTDLSRQIIRMVDASQDTSVALAVSDLAEGRQLILSGEVHGLLMLPRNLERDVLSGRRPEVVFFYNSQTMTTGNLVLRGVNAAVPTVAAGIRLSFRTAQGEPVDAAQAALAPVPVQVNPLFNPTLNYAHFLLAALMPSVLQVVIITTMAYSLGLDVESRHRLRILRRLGGGLWPALAGKILPYTLIFLAVLGIADLVLFDLLDMPLRGNRALLLMAGTLFILASQFIGVLLALLLRPMASAISIGSLLAAPAFGFMGIGFPRIGMNDFAYYYGQMIPGTWYLMARIDQTIRGTPLDLSWKPILVLLFLVVLLASVTVLRLETMRSRNRREASALREATR
ncbi:ABC transporter permease [Rhizobium ruizarguesonis]|jgi:ABC-2 type transport system permease protein|uniref:ABC transporter permease n=1 Tax=Rhizobium ruizarguesonis TaxID=2081791 RepID=A0AAE4YVR8_9HYPH|nr:ABC transporter permease [Rhizobium ruizarguesonis]TBY94925.1 ABC transporter permease [Rhizobium leguminosarum bv. viciae]MCB2404040.1 ABC transporter permease [Rhizobium ruizarguesonis]NEI51559.1 ABC transporter permease [Rhizobium ruizarguesonis]TAY70376.1 ABC transporter permease [Rhizobium ruizarguesonis]TAZ24756.1 ABC transporter permease [Rhizobium ruizarguesonis]